MQFPIFTIAGRIYLNPSAQGVSLTTPMMTLVSEGGGELSFSLPAVTAVISGTVGQVGVVATTMPRISITATAIASGSAIIDKPLPMLRLESQASQEGVVTFDKFIPMWRLDSVATPGYVATLERAYPSITLMSTASWLGAATIALELPFWELTAAARGSNYGLSLNPRNMAFSTYSAYDYSDLAYFNGEVVALNRTGLFELSGSVDGESEILWKIRTGKVDLAHNHIRQVWVTGKFGSRFIITIEDIEGNRYEYEAVPWSDDPNEVRIKLGKGIRSRYVTIELSGADIAEIDQIKVFGVRGGMKR